MNYLTDGLKSIQTSIKESVKSFKSEKDDEKMKDEIIQEMGNTRTCPGFLCACISHARTGPHSCFITP